jgi:hypothetical protein
MLTLCTMGKPKTITLSSIFPAVPERIWPLLVRIDTLRYIAFPYAVFSLAGDTVVTEWREGETLRFKLRIFGFIPLGIHSIRAEEMNRDAFIIRSCEGNRFVPVWNHTITLKPSGPNSTEYTDSIELEAGPLTGLVLIWGTAFYRHRQKKWIKMLLNQS